MVGGGTLVLLAPETAGEHAPGLTAQQSRMTVLFECYPVAAAFREELVFRGYLEHFKKSAAGAEPDF